jgi:hypothetical protein
VDRACGFFERYSSHTISGTPTGAFAIFARAFYAVAIGDAAGEHDSLERQIRQAAKRFSSRRQLAGRKSSKNPSDLS